MVIWIILLSVIGFVVMGIDKRRAIHHKYRIAEKKLWLIAIVGGAIGTFLGMIVWRHKIRKLHFVFGFICLAILDWMLLLSGIWNFDAIHMKG